jgi:hypothetical protein
MKEAESFSASFPISSRIVNFPGFAELGVKTITTLLTDEKYEQSLYTDNGQGLSQHN